eukprot:CAMPEP_0175746134 /NCGR_PEP_ID=MMETSP0097-20121207/58434_1 /TAXON_ID=311494 /ORGANISM="Alexandrium monilatum, Strain CCMP3105" /LENGTH=256 /DNA_ID=CAMNT_0017054561 /DNA_START=64 /DNA_END=832 /DNA_ORIENTATION=-
MGSRMIFALELDIVAWDEVLCLCCSWTTIWMQGGGETSPQARSGQILDPDLPSFRHERVHIHVGESPLRPSSWSWTCPGEDSSDHMRPHVDDLDVFPLVHQEACVVALALHHGAQLLRRLKPHGSVVEDVPVAGARRATRAGGSRPSEPRKLLRLRRPLGRGAAAVVHERLVGAGLGRLPIVAHHAAELVEDVPERAVGGLLQFQPHVDVAVPADLAQHPVHGPEALQVDQQEGGQPQEARALRPQQVLHRLTHGA